MLSFNRPNLPIQYGGLVKVWFLSTWTMTPPTDMLLGRKDILDFKSLVPRRGRKEGRKKEGREERKKAEKRNLE